MNPETREEHIELLRALIIKHSDIQFQLGWWAVTTLDTFGMTCQALADEINIGYKALNDWVNLARFWPRVWMDAEWEVRVNQLHEARESGLLNYSHFRAAKRVGSAQADVSAAQVEKAVEYLEHILNDTPPHSQMDAEVVTLAGGEEFTSASKVWDSRDYKELSATDMGREVANRIREIRLDGQIARVVVYAETK